MRDCFSVLVTSLVVLGAMPPLIKAQDSLKADKQLSNGERLDHVKKLAKAGKKATKEDIESLTHFLRDKAPEIRTEAVAGLANILLEQGKNCPLDLARTLLDPHAEVRGAALNIGLFQKFSAESLPVLLEAMQSEDALVRANVPVMLTQWGKEAQVVAALTKATSDKNWLTRNNAGVTLGKILKDVSIPLPCWLEAIGMAEKPMVDKKQAAAIQVIALGGATQMKDLSKENPKVLAVALKQQLANPSPLIRRMAVRNLGAMAIDNPKAREILQSLRVVEVLERFLDDPDLAMREEAKTARRRVRP